MEEANLRSARFTALFEQHYDAVLRYAQRRIDPATAVDVAADVFLVAWRRLDDVPRDSLPWLLVTARRTLANYRRSRDRTRSLQVRLQDHHRPDDPHDELAADLVARRRWQDAFTSLTALEQEVLTLAVWDGLSAAHAAQVLGCGVSAYVMRLHRARRQLRRLLAEPDALPEHRRSWTAAADQKGPA